MVKKKRTGMVVTGRVRTDFEQSHGGAQIGKSGDVLPIMACDALCFWRQYGFIYNSDPGAL